MMAVLFSRYLSPSSPSTLVPHADQIVKYVPLYHGMRQ